MRNKYTILNGYIESNKEKCEIPFALVFLQEGVYYIETFLADSDFYEKTKNSYYYQLKGKTEKGYDIECLGLFCTKYQYNNRKAVFVCDKCIKLINNKNNSPEVDNSIPEDDPIYFTEIEGLKMRFGDHTEIEKYRRSGKVDNLLNFEFDHTDCSFIINHPDFIGNHYNLLFVKSPENENILIDFRHHEGYSKLSYKNYLKIRTDLISFLSFMNGAQIYLRKELTGDFLTIKGANSGYDAQIVTLYSLKHRKEIHCNDYLPINEHHSYTSEILHKMFLMGFDKFFNLNKILDFHSLIYSLNSTNSTGLEERYFVLITALERISRNYTNNKSYESKDLIDRDFFENHIKPKLKELLSDFKKDIINFNKSAWDIYCSKIGNLNRRNNAETTQKLYEFLNYAKIKISSPVVNLVENERNTAVHEGIIGKNDKERIQNYWKLDHILRDIILNLIEYKGLRKRKYDYEKEINNEEK